MATNIGVDENSSSQSEHDITREVRSCTKVFIKQLISCKPMDVLQAEIATQNELRRDLNWFQLLAIGLGSIIGAGVFVLSGQAAAQYSGPSIIISFVITGVIALLASLSYSELGAMMPSSGSVYTYTYAALGEYLAWFIGWNTGLLYLFSILTLTVAWGKYVVLFVDIVSDYNVTSMIVQAPVAWNEDAERFYVTGQAINLPAIGITIAITMLLLIRIRQTAIISKMNEEDFQQDFTFDGEINKTKNLKSKKKNKSNGFQSFGLSSPVFKAIMKRGYKVPTPIQRKAIPVILKNKDIVAMARTGSGKTAAFLIPMFEKLKGHDPNSGPRALILSPTRELALQTLKFTKELGKLTDLIATAILGGERLEEQFSNLHAHPDIIIATPGRFMHLCIEMDLKLYDIKYVVLDERDCYV
ncbi:unnamed protein product [Rotaria sp. Silwood1]|nr:unnamed protein product [Rotaria sp. Silwood1]